MVTTTLYNFISSELIKRGFNEYEDSEGNFVFYEKEHQFMTKILSYDENVNEIVNEIFNAAKLKDDIHDKHFKKAFLYRFINREINRQTIESFKLELLTTFISNEDYINRVYTDLEKFLTQTTISNQQNKQTNKQTTDGTTVSDNRSAFADLPQSSVNLNVDSTIMESANDNTISRNKQKNTQLSDGFTSNENTNENKVFQLDELLKTNGLLEQIYNIFDLKCFLQVW